MAEEEDTKLTSSNEQKKITTTYGTTVYESDLKTSRKIFVQLKVQRQKHKKG